MSKIDFGELRNDTNLISRVQNVQEALEEIDKHVDKVLELKYEDLSIEDKIDRDIFLAFAMNSLYFMHLKITGDGASQMNDVKHELSRVKSLMDRQKELKESKNRPTIHKDATNRVVKSALYDVQQKNEEFRKKRETKYQQQQPKIYIGENPNPMNRKRRFNDD